MFRYFRKAVFNIFKGGGHIKNRITIAPKNLTENTAKLSQASVLNNLILYITIDVKFWQIYGRVIYFMDNTSRN